MPTSSYTDQLVDLRQEHLGRCCLHKELCLVYLIHSVAVHGKIDGTVLAALHGLYGTKDEYLSDLLNELKRENSCDAVAKFISDNILNEIHASFPSSLVLKLMMKQRANMKALVTKVLDALKNDRSQCVIYRSMLATLSVDQQPCASTKTVAPSSNGVLLSLYADVWQKIFRFLSLETVLGSLPVVCKAWNGGLPLKTLIYDFEFQKTYLRTLLDADSTRDGDLAQLNRCLPDEKSMLLYFGRLFINGVFGKAELEQNAVEDRGQKYLSAVMSNQIRPPRAKDRTFLCDKYVKLFKWVHGFSLWKPIFDKLKFLTDYEYGRAIRRLVHKWRVIPKLPESWIVKNMFGLFEIIEKDEKLMEDLIRQEYGNDFVRPSIILVLDKRELDALSLLTMNRLAKLVFSRTRLFKRLADEGWESNCGYLHFFLYYPETFCTIAAYDCWIPEFVQLFVSLVLRFKRSSKNPREIMTAICDAQLSWEGQRRRIFSKVFNFGWNLESYLKGTGQSQETIQYIKSLMKEYVYKDQIKTP